MILESTCFVTGGVFKEFCIRAQRKEGPWRFAFSPWFVSTEYRIPLAKGERLMPDGKERRLIKRFNLSPEQIKWRRYKIAEMRGDENYFTQEFATHPRGGVDYARLLRLPRSRAR